MSLNFGDVQLLDKLNFLGGASRLDFFLKTCKTLGRKGYFPYERFEDPKQLNNTQLPPHETFFSKLRKNNPLRKDYSDYQNLESEGLASKEALWKLKLTQSPATLPETYHYWTSVLQQENMRNLKDFLRWYNNKYVVPILEVLQKMVDFYHIKKVTC